MGKRIFILFSALIVFTLFCDQPVRAQDALPEFKIRVDLSPEYVMFLPGQTHVDELYGYSLPSGMKDNETKKNGQKRSRLSFSVSRLVVGGERVDPFEDDKISKWNMLKSLPGDFANAPGYQERLEIVGKIFEPKVTLDIEF